MCLCNTDMIYKFNNSVHSKNTAKVQQALGVDICCDMHDEQILHPLLLRWIGIKSYNIASKNELKGTLNVTGTDQESSV